MIVLKKLNQDVLNLQQLSIESVVQALTSLISVFAQCYGGIEFPLIAKAFSGHDVVDVSLSPISDLFGHKSATLQAMNAVYSYLDGVQNFIEIDRAQQQLPLHLRVMCSVINNITQLQPVRFINTLGEFEFQKYYQTFLNIVDAALIRLKVKMSQIDGEQPGCDFTQPTQLHKLIQKHVEGYTGYPLQFIMQLLRQYKVRTIEELQYSDEQLQFSPVVTTSRTIVAQLSAPLQNTYISRLNEILSQLERSIIQVLDLPVVVKQLENCLKPVYKKILHRNLFNTNNERKQHEQLKYIDDRAAKQIQRTVSEDEQLVIVGRLDTFMETYVYYYTKGINNQNAEKEASYLMEEVKFLFQIENVDKIEDILLEIECEMVKYRLILVDALHNVTRKPMYIDTMDYGLKDEAIKALLTVFLIETDAPFSYFAGVRDYFTKFLDDSNQDKKLILEFNAAHNTKYIQTQQVIHHIDKLNQQLQPHYFDMFIKQLHHQQAKIKLQRIVNLTFLRQIECLFITKTARLSIQNLFIFFHQYAELHPEVLELDREEISVQQQLEIYLLRFQTVQPQLVSDLNKFCSELQIDPYVLAERGKPQFRCNLYTQLTIQLQEIFGIKWEFDCFQLFDSLQGEIEIRRLQQLNGKYKTLFGQYNVNIRDLNEMTDAVASLMKKLPEEKQSAIAIRIEQDYDGKLVMTNEELAAVSRIQQILRVFTGYDFARKKQYRNIRVYDLYQAMEQLMEVLESKKYG